jgi:micrococcal nuclease
MKSFSKIFLFVFASLLIFPAASPAEQYQVINIIDGDTIVATGNDIMIMVRLVAIDAPEFANSKDEEGQPYCRQAKKFLINLLLNKTVDIKGSSLDEHNRLLGIVYQEDKCINLEMIKSGLAEVYYSKLPQGIDIIPYLIAEREARDALKGIWSLGEDYISPSEWCNKSR